MSNVLTTVPNGFKGMNALETTIPWHAVDPALAWRIPAARQQLHHALQLATALGISFMRHEPDDSHTNLGWSSEHQALVSRTVRTSGGALAIGIRVPDLTMLVTVDGTVATRIALHALTLAGAATQIRAELESHGLDAAQYTLDRHYAIPAHAVASGGTFDASDHEAFVALGHWLANADAVLRGIATRLGGSEVRLWPHHADIATLIRVANKSTGAGLVMGDGYFADPYFYVNMYPAPDAAKPLPALDGEGSWHTHEWTGAVLPVSRVLAGDPAAQARQVAAFLTSALRATTRLFRA